MEVVGAIPTKFFSEKTSIDLLKEQRNDGSEKRVQESYEKVVKNRINFT
ncbi:hypothetical protein PH210_06235 [Paenibacillus sp. BSR1-1]|nr:hypothetical protein [Paenibacillus sp. BSR1-1]MDN3015804.1 hypothetical protein [Paenibacillus sp. BSR1-1]